MKSKSRGKSKGKTSSKSVKNKTSIKKSKPSVKIVKKSSNKSVKKKAVKRIVKSKTVKSLKKKPVKKKPRIFVKGYIRKSTSKKGGKGKIIKSKYIVRGVNPPRIGTGIPGFDNLIEGGFVETSANLIGGDTGSGKSIFATQFVINGILKYKENAVYLNFQEGKEDFYKRMMRFGWDLKALEKDRKFIYLGYSPEQVEKIIYSGGGLISDAIDSINAKRIVIDSLNSFTFLFDDKHKEREALLALFRMIKSWGCTSLMINEHEQDIKGHHTELMEFEVDGDIIIYTNLVGKKRVRFLEVYKMRAVHHSRRIYRMHITSKGIIIRST